MRILKFALFTFLFQAYSFTVFSQLTAPTDVSTTESPFCETTFPVDVTFGNCSGLDATILVFPIPPITGITTSFLNISTVNGVASGSFDLTIPAGFSGDLQFGFQVSSVTNGGTCNASIDETSLWTSPFSILCPITHDQCSDAYEDVTLGLCDVLQPLSNTGAQDESTVGLAPCPSCVSDCTTPINDIWVSFMSDPNENGTTVSFDGLNNVFGEIFDACGGQSLFCSAGPTIDMGSVPAGEYYLRIWTEDSSEGDMNICVDYQDSVLPVELTGFKVDNQQDKNELTWTTLSEVNASHFEIQRSSDKNYNTISEIEATGSSLQKESYTFTDRSPHAQNYYRLKIVDHDGNFEYSKTVYTENKTVGRLNIYPNPFTHTILLDNYKEEKIIIQDTHGKVIANYKGKSSIDLSHLTKGVYFISIPSKNICEKIVKL